jgi:hypothetical protein
MFSIRISGGTLATLIESFSWFSSVYPSHTNFLSTPFQFIVHGHRIIQCCKRQEIVRKLSNPYGTRRFITVTTKVRHWSLFNPHPQILAISFASTLCLSSSLIPWDFPIRILYHFLYFKYTLRASPISSSSSAAVIIFGAEYHLCSFMQRNLLYVYRFILTTESFVLPISSCSMLWRLAYTNPE